MANSGERMKMGTPHIVPLSTQAVEVLSRLHELRGRSGLFSRRARPRKAHEEQYALIRAVPHGLPWAHDRPRLSGHRVNVLHELGFGMT